MAPTPSIRKGYNKIAEVTDDIYKSFDLKEATVSVFIDFKKAFDTVTN